MEIINICFENQNGGSIWDNLVGFVVIQIDNY